MLFHAFKSQDDRRKFGGSAFIEMQFCRLSVNSTIKKLVAVENIDHWCKDSLYIDDECWFYREYAFAFDCGVYGNLKSGTMDLFGINYYAPATVDSIIKKIDENKPSEYETLRAWLIRAKEYNGFYILGM